MKKRALSLLLALCMTLSLLPLTALAAVGDLLQNDPAENESLLSQLESFTGESYEEAYELLSALGLLDEEGNLITDQTIVLNGAEYTLEEVEALLSDPDTDLGEVAEVDGVPIALGDLATIIAIERELQRLQETYFSGRTFEGEALENVNSLMAQLQTEGLTLAASTRSTGDQIVFDTSNVQQAQNDISPIYYISAGTVTIPQGTTLTVKFKLNLSDAIKKDQFLFNMPAVYLSDTPTDDKLSEDNFYLHQDGKNSAIIYIQNGATTAEEYTLSITANYPYKGPLYLCLRGPSLQNSATMNYKTDFTKYSYGDIWQAVSFYDANGFFFQNGSGGALRDQWTGYFSVENSLPAMGNSCSVTGNQLSFQGGRNFLEFSLVGSTATIVENTLTYLQRCIDDLRTDNAVRFQLEATLAQSNNKSYPLIIPKDVFIHTNSGKDDLEYHGYYIIEESSLIGSFPITLASGSGTTTISFTGLTDKFNSSDGKSCILPRRFSTVMCNSQYVTPEQIDDLDKISQYTYSINDFTSTTDCTINLVRDNIKPTLKVTARAGDYQSGDVIPITITGNEFIKVDNLSNTKITINGSSYSLSDLHASSSGKYISLFYEVKEIDDPKLTVTILADAGITDYWGNGNAEVNAVTVSGVTINTPVLKNAPTGLTASYDADAQQLSVGITVNQAEAYQNLYKTYGNNTMQLLISVDGAAAATRPVTMGGSGSTITFTAQPYTIERKAAEQTVTVQLQVNDGGSGWTTVKWLSASATVPELVKVESVTVSRVDGGSDDKLTLADSTTVQLKAVITPSNATDQTGAWHSSDDTIATITADGRITPKAVGSVSFYYVANNGGEAVKSNELTFTVTAGDKLTLVFPDYAQDSLVRAGSAATVTWITNAMEFYPDTEIEFTVRLYAGDGTGGAKVYEDTVISDNELTIPAEHLTADYPQSRYTVEVSMASPEPRSDTASITVLSPPTQVRVTAESTSITDQDTLVLNCTISNAAAGALVVKRMTAGSAVAEDVTTDCLSETSVSDGGASVLFTPKPVADGSLYDTYTVTFTEQYAGSADPSFTPSTDSMVLTVYRSGALDILVDGQSQETIALSNRSVAATLPTDSQGIMALRQQLGLIEYVSINADAYNWSSFSDGIQWVTDDPEAVGIYYRQGGLWDNIEDLIYETYLPQSQMAVSATDDADRVTITAIHDATNMRDSVTVSVETLRDKLYLFQVSPAEETTLTYVNGDGETKTATTTADGVLAIYEESGIRSDVYLRSGTAEEPNLGTIRQSALSSGEKDAAKLQLYPLNTVTLYPAARAELYLVKPDGTPYANANVTLRGGVYLDGIYCEDVKMGSDKEHFVFGTEDGAYTTDADGKLTIYMDATQFVPDGYGGQLTNTALDYWFELSDLANDGYYPTLVNIQGSMTPDYSLRTGSAVVTLREVPAGEAEQPFLIAQTLSYAKDSADDLQVRSVMGSTGKVGPNSTYQYTELTTRIMLWGVEADNGAATVAMAGADGYIPAEQTVVDNTFPFASIPIVTNTLVLTKQTMTESGWLAEETPANLKARVSQNGALLKTVTMPFQIIDLTDVRLVDEDATALVAEMTASLQDGFGTTDGQFNFGSNMVGNAFGSKVTEVLNGVQENVNPLFRVLITPSEDSSVFNVLIWGGYNSLDIDDFDYSSPGFSMGSSLMEAELDVGVPPLNDLSDMAKGTYDPVGTINETKYNRTNSGLDIGAQLEGYYEGQFYYDTEQHKWAFRTISGGMTAGASASFQANINAWAGPVPITATFAAGIALQLDFKAATVYTDQVADISGWTAEAQEADSVNDYLTTLRIQGYVDAFGGLGFDYSIIALKIGLYGRITADSTNIFLSRTYLQKDKQMNGQALGISGEVGIKFFAKLLFVSYEVVIGSGNASYSETFNNYKDINDYWNGTSADGASLLSVGAPTLLSRAYLTAYANRARTWGTPAFNSDANAVLSDANPGSEPEVNDDGSLSVYISDEESPDYFDSRIRAGTVGTEGSVIDGGGHGDMSPSISGSGSFSVAAWVRLFEELEAKGEGEAITADEYTRLLNSTEVMAAIYTGGSWTTTQLTENASSDLAPVTAANDDSAIVFWRGVYTADAGFFDSDGSTPTAPKFETRDAIYFRQYSGGWGETKMAYNGSLGSVVGIQTAMLSDGSSIVVFVIDRGSDDPEDPYKGYEIAYRTVDASGGLGDLVVLTSDSETDTNPQVMAVSSTPGVFLLGWYSTRDGGDIRLQAVGADGQLYGAGSAYAVPESVRAIADEDALDISADFQFARQYQPGSIDGVTLVWPEMAYVETADGTFTADHSVLYGTRLCETAPGQFCLSTPQALITLPDRTLANSFSAWQDSAGKVSAYIFGTWYDPDDNDPEYEAQGLSVPLDTDKLLTGGSTMQAYAVSVESIFVDYPTLKAGSWTPVTFTLRNTGTARLTGLTVEVGGYSSASADLDPGQSKTFFVDYKTTDPITNPAYTIRAGGSEITSGTLHLDYNGLGISAMEVVREGDGKRTVRVTLYNDAPAKLEGSGRTVELNFYTDSERTKATNVTLSAPQAGVSVSGSTITFQGDALRRIDQGSMTLLVEYDLADYVETTLNQEEVPESGVYLYASSAVKDGSKTMAEYAAGNNAAAVQLTGLYARSGEQATTLDAALANSDVTRATVTLRNNSLQPQPSQGTLVAVLLDADGKELETQVVTTSTALACEETLSVPVTFTQLGADVMLLYSAAGGTGLQELRFTGMDAELSDFVLVTDEEDPNYGCYVYTLGGNAPASTTVAFISDSSVTVNGVAYDAAGSAPVEIPVGESAITITTGTDTYILNLSRSSGGTVISGYNITIEPGRRGTVTAGRTWASGGSTVVLTLEPDEGCWLAQLTVTDRSGSEIETWAWEEGGYAFTMPRSSVTVRVSFLPFTDISPEVWYLDGVCYAYENELVDGTGDTTFSPGITMSRAMCAAILWNLEGSPVVNYAMTYEDVSQGAWYAEAIRWASSEGLVEGYSAQRFGPGDPITREQMATLLHRYCQYKGYSADGSGDLSGYTDLASVSGYALEAMEWAVGTGLIQGTSETTLSPRTDMNRAWAAVLLTRFCRTYVQP